MNWMRILLDGIAMAVVFNAVVGMFWFIMPHAYSRMFPGEIKEIAGPCSKQEVRNLALVLYPLYLGVMAWMILSAYSAGITGFWTLFWSAYLEMLLVNFGDFFILDCWLRAVARKRNMLPGTEHCKAWEWEEWMKQAVPEHFLGWPILFCTLVGFICAGIGTWIR